MEYILDARTYLPNFLKESDLILSIIDCLNVLISTEQPVFEQIKEAYQDTLYRCRDYSKLTYEAKINIIKELGFDYIVDTFNVSSDQLTQLLIFFNLIYALKGKKEGLKLCLDTLGITYSYVTWDELSPKGTRFTADLNIVGNEYSSSDVLKKIQNFVRCYMLPWINVSVEATVEGPALYLYPSGYLNYGRKSSITFSAIRDVANVAMYDKDLYDSSYYGTKIYDGPDQDDPYIFENVQLTITCNKENAIIKIEDEVRSTKQVEKGTIIPYSVTYNSETRNRTVVCNQDKTVEVIF